MKKILLTFMACYGLNSEAGAQPFSYEYLDVNLINANHAVNGDMWHGDYSPGSISMEYPKSTGKSLASSGGIWIAAKDNNDSIRCAAILYKTGGAVDYMPGPLNSSDTIDYATSSDWAKIWKVNQSDINYFLSLSSKTTSTIPASILEWPGKGNSYAKGYAGASISISEDMAPFVDSDGDGIYDPTKGDYPKIKGDQALWWIINDNGGPHMVTKSLALKVEIHILAYAYSRGTAVDRMLFYEYEILNKSDQNYKDFRLGLWADGDLGNPFDDNIAVDSSRRMGVFFQDKTDGGAGLGASQPLLGFSIVEMPGDTYPGGMQSIGSFAYFNNTAVGPIKTPNGKYDFYNYLQGKNTDGDPIEPDPGGTGNLAYYDLKADSTLCPVTSYDDRRILLGTQLFKLDSNTRKKVGIAVAVTDTNGHICPNLKTDEMKDVMDSAWVVYYNPLPTMAIKEKQLSNTLFKVYPNPSTDNIFVELKHIVQQSHLDIRIIDALGRSINLPIQNINSKLIQVNISSLSSGIYSILLSDGATEANARFIKE